MAFRKVVFAPTNQKKVQAMNNTTCSKAEARIRKEKTRKVPILNQNFQPRKHPVKKDMAIPGNQTNGVPVYLIIPQPQLLDGVARDIVHGWQQSHWILPTIRHTLFWILAAHGQWDQERQSKRLQKHALYYGITTEFCRCKNPVVFANFATETCWESCIIHFPTTPPRSTRVDVLETGYVPTLFLSSSDETFGYDYWLGSERRQNYMSSFWLVLISSWILNNGTFWFWIWRVLRTRQNRVSVSEQKSANPARTRELDEDDDDKPLVCPDNVTVSENEDDEPLVRPSSELIKEKRDSAA